MTLRTLGVGLALFAAGPSYAQDAGPSPFTNPDDPAAIRMAAAFEDLEKALNALEPRAEAIRADDTLPGQVRRERLLKLLSQEEARLQEVEAALAGAVRRHMERENATPEQVLLAIEINRQHMMTGIVEEFVTGRNPHGLEPEKAP